MKALVVRHSLAREAASAIGGRVDRRAFVSRFAPARIEDVAEPPLPAPDWVRVRTTFSGLCGSDVKQILLNGSRDNPLTALVSFPHVLGHFNLPVPTDSEFLRQRLFYFVGIPFTVCRVISFVVDSRSGKVEKY